MSTPSSRALIALTLLVVAAPALAQAPDPALVARARAIHERVITLDTHDDIDPRNFTKARNYTQRLDNQVNLPKMEEGGLDVAFFIVFVGQGPLTQDGYDKAYAQAMEKFDAVHRLTKEIAPTRIGLALTAADVRSIAASGRKVAVIGIENAYPVGTNLARIKEFHDRGGRYMSLAHNGHSQFADSNTGERDGQWLHNGLSELGKQAIAEMNRWGIMVDVSHPSKAANLQAIALSKAPVIASHSAARALANHSRNMDDEQLQALKKNGGVIQTVAFDGYVEDQAAGFTRAGRGAGQGAGRHAAGRTGRDDRCAAHRLPRPDGRGRQAVPAGADGHGRRLREPHRLPGEDHRRRPRRHLVGLRRRRRRGRLERRRGDLQCHPRAGEARLRRGTDRQAVERQPAPRDGRRRADRQGDPGGKR